MMIATTRTRLQLCRLPRHCTIVLAGVIGLSQPAFLPTSDGWTQSTGAAAFAQEKRDAGQDKDKEARQKKGPAEWRDNEQAELRRHWDTLEGKPATELGGLKDWLQTEARSWKDYQGKVVILDYWATWCKPCRDGIPHLVELYEKNHEKGLEILGVHSARGFEKMPAFVSDNKLPYNFAADSDRVLGEKLGVQFIPCYFVIDRNGIMRVAGANRNKLDEIVETLLAEPAAGGNDGWPAYVKKNLYANDFRGKKGPDLQVEEWLSDKPDTTGKIVMVDFWATWCTPCKNLIPEVNEFQKQFKDDLVIIGLSGDETVQIARDFVDKTEMNYAQAVDTKNRAHMALGIKGIPHVIIMSTDGIIRWQGFPLSAEEPLTADIIKSIIERDPGVAARREAEKADKNKKKNDRTKG